uniref:Uncharacterized protein n=1 Tax=Kalanchoe fedtschenkoi TaxID=63787 RepID=A0A7N1A5J8_KALFE
MDTLRKEALWEVDVVLSKIKRMKKTQQNMDGTASRGITLTFLSKKRSQMA